MKDELAELRAEVERLRAEVAPLRAYRVAYFAYWMADMWARREYERNRAKMSEEEFDAWLDAQMRRPHDSTFWQMREAEAALTAPEHWPDDYRQLVEEMKAEFGD